MNVPAGELDQRVDILEPSDTQDSFGQYDEDVTDDFLTRDTVWASIKPQSTGSTENEQENVTTVRRSVEIRLRYYPNLDESFRIRDRDSGDVNQIRTIVNKGMKDRLLILECEVVK